MDQVDQNGDLEDCGRIGRGDRHVNGKAFNALSWNQDAPRTVAAHPVSDTDGTLDAGENLVNLQPAVL